MKLQNLTRFLMSTSAIIGLVACGTPQRAEQRSIYGPLTFNNQKGADFYIARSDKFAEACVVEGTVEFHLKNSPIQIGHNGRQMNICLARVPFDEVRADPQGYKASCLSGAMAGSTAVNNDLLLVYSGKKWRDGNTELSDAGSRKVTPLPGYKFAYQINDLLFVGENGLDFTDFRGTLHGYLAVYKQHERSNKDIMPIRLVFE